VLIIKRLRKTFGVKKVAHPAYRIKSAQASKTQTSEWWQDMAEWRLRLRDDFEDIGRNHELMWLVLIQWTQTGELPEVSKIQWVADRLRRELIEKLNYQPIFPN